jgi:hypothetical protein
MNTNFAPSRLRCDPPRVFRGRLGRGQTPEGRTAKMRRCEGKVIRGFGFIQYGGSNRRNPWIRMTARKARLRGGTSAHPSRGTRPGMPVVMLRVAASTRDCIQSTVRGAAQTRWSSSAGTPSARTAAPTMPPAMGGGGVGVPPAADAGLDGGKDIARVGQGRVERDSHGGGHETRRSALHPIP